jgi:Tfp pilus assembly protein PilN
MRPINLLPPELARKKRARRKVGGIIGLIVLYMILLALVTYWQDGKAQSVEADLVAQRQENQATQAQIDALSGARDLRGQYEDGVARVQSALATDVAWGRLFNDLARVIPDRVWLTSFDGNVTSTSDGEVGQVEVGAVAFDYPDASTWLRVVDSDVWPAMAAGWVTSAQVGAIGEIPVVNFQSSAFLTQASLSSRAEDRIPEVPK